MLCLQDVSDPVTLQLVEAAVRDNTSLKKLTIKPSYTSDQLTWTNVAVAILNGAANSETLGTLQLCIPDEPLPAPELVDEVGLGTLELVIPDEPFPVPELVNEIGLGTLELVIPDEPFPVPELVDEVRRSNPKLQLTVRAGRSCESEHVTVGMTVA